MSDVIPEQDEFPVVKEPIASVLPPFDVSKVLVVLAETPNHVVISQPDSFLYKPGENPGALKEFFRGIAQGTDTGYRIQTYDRADFQDICQSRNADTASLGDYIVSLENYDASVKAYARAKQDGVPDDILPEKPVRPEAIEKLGVVSMQMYEDYHRLIDGSTRWSTGMPVAAAEVEMERRMQVIEDQKAEIGSQWKELGFQKELMGRLPYEFGKALEYDYSLEGAQGNAINYSFVSAPVLLAENENGGLVHQPLKDGGTGEVKGDGIVFYGKEGIAAMKSTGGLIDYDQYRQDIQYAKANPDKAGEDNNFGHSRLNEMEVDAVAYGARVDMQREELFVAAKEFGFAKESQDPSVDNEIFMKMN